MLMQPSAGGGRAAPTQAILRSTKVPQASPDGRGEPAKPGVENMLGHAPPPLTAEAVWTCATATRPRSEPAPPSEVLTPRRHRSAPVQHRIGVSIIKPFETWAKRPPRRSASEPPRDQAAANRREQSRAVAQGRLKWRGRQGGRRQREIDLISICAVSISTRVSYQGEEESLMRIRSVGRFVTLKRFALLATVLGCGLRCFAPMLAQASALD